MKRLEKGSKRELRKSPNQPANAQGFQLHLVGVMPLQAYGHIFCAWLPFGGWYQTLLSQKEEVPSDVPVEGEEGIVQERMFEVDTKPPHCTRALVNYSSDPRPKRMSHALVDEIAVHS